MFLYYFCRYWVMACVPVVLWVFVTDHTEAQCRKLYNIPVLLALWNQASAEAILLLRTYAFFGQNRALGVGLVACLSGVIAYQMWVGIAAMELLPFLFPPFDKGPCFPVAHPGSLHVTGFFIAPLIFDTLVTILSVGRAVSLSRASGATSALMKTFVREGLFYFILISIANLINGIFYLQPKQVLSSLNIPLSIMFPNILACRLILDLREAGTATNISHNTSSFSRPPLSGGAGPSPIVFSLGSRSRGNSIGAQQALSGDAKPISFVDGSNKVVKNVPLNSYYPGGGDVEKDSLEGPRDLEANVYNTTSSKKKRHSRSRSNTAGTEGIPMDTFVKSALPSLGSPTNGNFGEAGNPFSKVKQPGIRVEVQSMRYEVDDASSESTHRKVGEAQ